MLFNSIQFGFFLVAVLALYWSAGERARKWILLGASYYFYSFAHPPYAFLLAFLTIFNFYLSKRVAGNRSTARIFLAIGVTVDLCSIGFYKYVNLILETFNVTGAFLGLTPQFPMLNVVLPIGISFYTFQMLSYLVDVHRGAEPEDSLRDFALYISFFTQLVAGPIVRPSVLLPQIKKRAIADAEQMQLGLFMIAQGLVKKIVFADNLGRHADAVFGDPMAFNSPSTLIATYAYAFQIYFDFSGYTDIAIGCGKLLGFEIPDNFNLPYLARNMREFWQRWHISLSTWLRDYLYISLGGSRKGGRAATYRNLFITMVLGGLWHGANWTFAIWGLYHGALIVINHIRRDSNILKAPEDSSTVRRVLQTIITFHLVCAGWVFFRSETFSKAITMFERLAALDFSGAVEGKDALMFLCVAVASHIIRETWRMEQWFIALPKPIQGWAYGMIAILIWVFFTQEQRFIYFQF
jgi:D-alanyl-lipoteichoic acid acyltransferase DltB (MBOAT superfamily)